MSGMAAVKEAVQAANEAGAAPGDIAQAVLEQCHGMDMMPCGDKRSCRVTTVDEETGRIEQKVMGPDADYVITLGPRFELASTQIYPTTDTTVLTIKKREAA